MKGGGDVTRGVACPGSAAAAAADSAARHLQRDLQQEQQQLSPWLCFASLWLRLKRRIPRQSVAEPCCPPTPPSRPRRVHAAAIPPSAMARPLQDRSRRTEPTAAAAVSGSPAFPLGGTVALPPAFCRSPRPWTPRLSGGRGPCGPSPAPGNGSLHPGTLPGVTHQSPRGEEVEEEGAAAAAAVEPEHGAAEANGHLPRHLPTLEQEIGARLRQMGDRFQQDYEQRERRPHGALWGHFYHLVFHLLGVLYNLPVRG